jgi:hypothetical protein
VQQLEIGASRHRRQNKNDDVLDAHRADEYRKSWTASIA